MDVSIEVAGTNQSTTCNRVFLQKLTVTQPRNSPPFAELRSSLSCSQEPVIGPYPEPDETTPHLSTLFP